jgi:hypothetical protein
MSKKIGYLYAVFAVFRRLLALQSQARKLLDKGGKPAATIARVTIARNITQFS